METVEESEEAAGGGFPCGSVGRGRRGSQRRGWADPRRRRTEGERVLRGEEGEGRMDIMEKSNELNLTVV